MAQRNGSSKARSITAEEEDEKLVVASEEEEDEDEEEIGDDEWVRFHSCRQSVNIWDPRYVVEAITNHMVDDEASALSKKYVWLLTNGTDWRASIWSEVGRLREEKW